MADEEEKIEASTHYTVGKYSNAQIFNLALSSKGWEAVCN